MTEQRHTLSDLTEDEVRELWSKTYNREGKPDWSHIFPYYSDDVVFRDSIQEIHGLEDFKAMCKRLTDRSKQLQMHIPSIVRSADCIFMQWEMTMSFKRYPSSTLYGATKLELDDEGRICSQRDYYDLWGDIFDNIPWFAGPYRRFMHRKFG
ncbi:nuclear transport factor 2 family protein [Candidatus Bipolaricaulota bacterium]|nr:nuclear transport factor 2 family protein [Candidatus Bipolaricaulota bacterium]